jgi:hypothetical protein
MKDYVSFLNIHNSIAGRTSPAQGFMSHYQETFVTHLSSKTSLFISPFMRFVFKRKLIGFEEKELLLNFSCFPFVFKLVMLYILNQESGCMQYSSHFFDILR